MDSVLVIGFAIFMVGELSLSEGVPDKFDFNVTKFIDPIFPDFPPFIKAMGFEPMKVPDVEDYISPATVKLTNGTLVGASKMKRAGDFSVSVYPKFNRLYAKVYFDELQGTFNYSLDALVFLSDRGVMNATIKNVTATLSIDLKIGPTFKLLRPVIKIEDYRSVSISMGDKSIGSLLKSLFVNVAAPFYRGHIVKIAETTALKIALTTIRNLNRNVNKMITNVGQLMRLFWRNMLTYNSMYKRH